MKKSITLNAVALAKLHTSKTKRLKEDLGLLEMMNSVDRSDVVSEADFFKTLKG